MTEEKRFEEESAGIIAAEIIKFVRTSPLNRMPDEPDSIIFDDPLVKFADGDDPIFTEYKTLIGPVHMTPREVLTRAYEKAPERISVISWILPITAQTRKSNRGETRTPSRPWSHTRYFGEMFNDALREYVVDILTETGHMAVAPSVQPYFKMERSERGLYSNWSERHIAFASGQGTFGLSDGFITEKGIAHRCGSVVTDMALPASPRVSGSPYANCLHDFDGTCMACSKRCPAGAITSEGHDKIKCGQYLNSIGYRPGSEYDIETSVAGCGLCQTKVPCEYRVPLKIQKSRAG